MANNDWNSDGEIFDLPPPSIDLACSTNHVHGDGSLTPKATVLQT